jgi:DNA-binding NarL/FixJ family response regulator
MTIQVVLAGDQPLLRAGLRRLIRACPRYQRGRRGRNRHRGGPSREIAAALLITPGTAKIRVARPLAKLGARDPVQLVIIAFGPGLVSAPHCRVGSHAA